MLQLNPCTFLFDKEPNEVFSNIKIFELEKKEKLINDSLALLMKVHDYLLKEKKALFLLDPAALNHQCHLYAIKAVQIYSSSLSDKKKFYHLCFFLSFSFVKDRNLYVSAVLKTIQEMEEKVPKPKKYFLSVLRDEGNCLRKISCLSLNQFFEKDLKKALEDKKKQSPLFQELYHLASEALHIEIDSSQLAFNRVKEPLYTYPKLAGTIYLFDTIEKENIPFILKVKVITKNGAIGKLLFFHKKQERDVPVLVLEGMATDGTYSLPFCKEQAKNCYSFFYRFENKKQHHKKEEFCFFCKSVEGDLSPFEKRIQKVLENKKEMFYALGADFQNNVQKEFVHFEKQEKYPNFTKIFQNTLSKIEPLGLGMKSPTTFSLAHVYPDFTEFANQETMLLETPPEELLKTRGIL